MTAASVHGGQGRGLRRKDSEGRALCGRCGAPYDGFAVHGPGACERAQSVRELTDYELGYIAGLAAFAWFKDGTRWVGTTGTTFRDAAMNFLIPRGWSYDDAKRIAHDA